MRLDRFRAVLATRRRMLLAVLLVSSLAIGGLAAIRITNVHDPVAWDSVDTDAQPGQVLEEVNRQLQHVDHRRVKQVWRIDGDRRHLRGFYEEAFDYSDRQWVANYFGPRPVDPDVTATQPMHYVLLPGPHGRALSYVEDRRAVQALWEADRPPEPGNYTVPSTVERVSQSDDVDYRELYARTFFIQDHDADWRVVDRSDGTVTLGIDSLERYFRTRKLTPSVDLHEGSRIRVRLDAESGRPIEVSERRVVTLDEQVEGPGEDDIDVRRRYTFELKTTFGDWETLDITRPPGVQFPAPSLRDYVQAFLSY